MTATGLVDTHAHLMDAAFEADLEEVVQGARAAGVNGFALVGYDLSSSRAAIDLAQRIEGACASVGIHPNSAGVHTHDQFDAIEQLTRHPVVAAVGETGLDYYRDRTPPSRQREALEWHLRLAEACRLPVIVHNREADADLAEALERSAARRTSADVPGVLHCFTSTDSGYLARVLEAGYFVSFAGNLTFKNAQAVRAMAARVPLERLLVETDCPFMAPVPHRGRRNEPAFVRDTAQCLADIRGVSFGAMVEALWRNSVRVFPALARTPVAS
ncbi:MAG: TatD family hydrolase [Chloroflexi bacterium]|nr:TatD family hydrolase [Chloroflexota bacterium]